MDIKQLRETIDKLFGNRGTLVTLWQELAENFYPERADFTVTRTMGTNYADNLTSSFPVRCRRDLGDQFSTMLRPTSKAWFHMKPTDDDRADNDATKWLEWAEGTQRRAMYDRASKFTRATKEGDHDFATFGQTVLSVRLNKYGNGLLYRCWHLRDVAWMENEESDINLIARKWKPYARDLKSIFGDKVHQNINTKASDQPFEEIDCYHIIIEAEMWDGDANGKPFVSIYYDIGNDHIMEEIPVFNKEYIIPRWQTVSGSQYAYSPASIIALPDARMIQAMTYTLLEAGEKATNPPMIATHDTVRSDIAVYAGGVTWVDMEYDERLGDALRPIDQDLRGLPIGMDQVAGTQAQLAEIFFLNKLTLPERGPEMTAYEVGQRIQEYVRGAIPIFEPMEMDYNGQLCETTFDLMMRAGAFGSPAEMPASLQGADIQFHFESPLHDAIEAQNGQKFMEMKELIAQAVELDQGAMSIPDTTTALREALKGIGVPSEWINSEIVSQEILDEQIRQAEMKEKLEMGEQGANIAEKLSNVDMEKMNAQ